MMYSNFKHEVWYTPQSQKDVQKPVRFLIKTIPYKFTSLPNVYTEYTNVELLNFLVSHCILDIQNIITDVPKQEIISNITKYVGKEIIDDLTAEITRLWMPSEDFMNSLNVTIDLMLDPRFTDGSWNCKTCQSRKLDKQRNCPLIDGTEHLDPMFKLPFMGETITECPIPKKDNRLAGVLIEGYKFFDSGVLPETGGIGDQAILFVIGTQHLSERVKYFKQQAEEESMKSSR